MGSGYGGGIAASRLARAGKKVCVLERGREFQPGDFPDTLLGAVAEMQVDTPLCHHGSRTGLYDFRINEDINVFQGCGLGGTSLVNANVSLRAEARVFEDARWPGEFRRDLKTRLEDGYQRAQGMLKPAPFPADLPPPPKLTALEHAAGKVGGTFYRLPINVNFTVDGPNQVGAIQHPCVQCGDCVSGCNHGAKNTIAMNYLPDAKNRGAEIFTRTSVRRVERAGNRWIVHYQLLDSERERFDAPTMFVSADVVILAAGTLGSTEILLRSEAAGLSLSSALGQRFTGNGDVLAFGYNADREIRGIGFGHRQPAHTDAVGPCITGVIDLREQARLADGMVIEEGVIPGALASLVPGTLALMASALGKTTARGVRRALTQRARQLQSMIAGPRSGAARHTMTYLVMGHDDAGGRVALGDDRARITWPGVGEQAAFRKIDQRARRVSAALGAIHLKNPTWTKLTNHGLVTVHPLGGCVMAEQAGAGVVNHKGQVFSERTGTRVHEGLYVCDGAIVPRPIGVNPLLTISAIAERCCALIAADRGWTIDYALRSPPRGKQREARLGLRFTETMRGHFSTKVTDDFRRAAARGEKDRSTFEFTVSVVSDDLDEMLKNSKHEARMLGTASAPALSPDPLTVTDGRFNLFVRDRRQARGAKEMRYRMTLNATDGRVYYLSGIKTIRDDWGPDLWPDTTTLFITLHAGPDDSAPVLGKGIVRIRPDDFLRQMQTLQVTNASGLAQRLGATARFGRFFASHLFDTYGGVFAKAVNSLSPRLPPPEPRKRRPLRMGAPEVHSVITGEPKESDRVELRLTRYEGGKKGPVILAPGFGTSSNSFTIDTTDVNLPEYLYARGYDVWLLDYRASPELPSSQTQFTVDDIAQFDWPAAVAAVRSVSGAKNVQVMGHCVGSMSFLMAMMAGLKGVRSAVCSQLTTHPDAPLMTKAKAGARLGELLFYGGLKRMSTHFDVESWIERLFDKFLLAYPTFEQCKSPVCRRILFMYGESYKHERLDQPTHHALHEIFGCANFTTLRHMTTMIRKGHVTDRRGRNVYLPNIKRLAIPIAFLHGGDNRMFLPSGSEKAFKLLGEKNGKGLYTRRVIEGYGHLDCFIGRDAATDVYPVILRELEKWN